LLQQPALDNAAMMQALERCYVRSPAPKPSIETLLHAGLPFRYVEHTHADAVLAALNVDTIDAVHAEVYGERAPLVPYHHSGHALARACMAVFTSRGTPNTIGLVLAFHGVVAFGNDARTAYQHMLELVTRAEDFLKARHAWSVTGAAPAATTADDDVDALRALHLHINAVAGLPLALHRVVDDASMAFVQRPDLAQITQQGPATPQHAIYTKRVPLIDRNVAAYAVRYRDYLDAHLGKPASLLIDAAPRIVLDPRWGLCAFGTTEHAARIAAQMYQHDIAIITRASAHAHYRSAPAAALAQAEFEYGGCAARLQASEKNNE
jgi:rhamnose utilization protein RhaD (predicted bifunctional aldolase and dehydrogenase)